MVTVFVPTKGTDVMSRSTPGPSTTTLWIDALSAMTNV
jgi:hypothetical protein